MNNLTLNQNLASAQAQNFYNVRDYKFVTPLARPVQIQSRPQNDEFSTASTAIGSAGLLRLAQWGLEKLSGVCSAKLMAGEEFASRAEVEKVANAMKSKKGLSAKIHYLDRHNVSELKGEFPNLANSLDVVAQGRNAFYTDQGNFACAPKSKPSLILHELGHATNFEKSAIMKGLQKLRVVGMVAPMAVAYLNKASGENSDGRKNFWERNAFAIGFGAFVPTIIEEAAASIRGIKAAGETLGKGAKLGVLKKNYALAWATYVLAGIGTGIAAKLAITKDK